MVSWSSFACTRIAFWSSWPQEYDGWLPIYYFTTLKYPLQRIRKHSEAIILSSHNITGNCLAKMQRWSILQHYHETQIQEKQPLMCASCFISICFDLMMFSNACQLQRKTNPWYTLGFQASCLYKIKCVCFNFFQAF